jgi:uncharacterized membrane protein
MLSQPTSIARLQSIDAIRGLVMILMALDHTRDLFHLDALRGDPTDLSFTNPALFFTRWITHLCAPTFVFLSGVSAFLSLSRNGDRTGTRNFLISRGVWLVFLELTVVNFGIWFDLTFSLYLFQVIGAIGFSLLALGLSLRLNPTAIGLIGILIVLFHPFATQLPIPADFLIHKVVSLLFTPQLVPFSADVTLLVAYPPIPWVGVLFIGYGVGRLFLLPPERQRKLFKRIGIELVFLFLILRYYNFYGDPTVWEPKSDRIFTLMSFLNLTKYPPSLQYNALMLGIMFVLLAAVPSLPKSIRNVLTTYGKVPLFYYVIHWYVIHLLLFVLLFAQGYHFSDLEFGFNFGRPSSGGGVPLAGVYAVWAGVVAALYPVCRWYGTYKQKNSHIKWLRYL